MNYDESVKHLSPVQHKAVAHEKGPLLILSGAGSGKTRVIAHRIANLVMRMSVPPDEIMAVTFTNKATNEMRGRIQDLVGEQGTPTWIGTFHSLCNRILRPNITRLGYTENFTIYVEEVLKAANVPHVVLSGERFFDLPEIKDITAYIQCVVNPNDSVSMKRIINNPHRGIGVTPISLVQRYADAKEITFWEAIQCIEEAPTLHGSVKLRVAKFRELIESFSPDGPPTITVEAILDVSGYLEAATRGGTIKAESRRDNFREFVQAVSEYEESAGERATLEGFLHQVSEMVEPTSAKEEDTVKLMTLHSAKGLEFPIVFMIGVEEGLLPHKKCIEQPGGIEEERRLCYVGMTRAEEELYMSHAYCRKSFYPNPSRFLDEVPDEYISHDSHEPTTSTFRPFREQQPDELSEVQKEILTELRKYLEGGN